MQMDSLSSNHATPVDLDKHRVSQKTVSELHPTDLRLHTASIAARLDAKTASEVATAAAAHLQLTQGHSQFSRKQLLADMKTATGRYKQAMASNMSQTLKTLIDKGTFHQQGSDQYCLADTVRRELTQKLG